MQALFISCTRFATVYYLMKQTRFELMIFLLLTIISIIGHYYLSWHCTVGPQTRYLLKFILIIVMVGTGYAGLIDHEIRWIKYIWAVLYILLMTGFGIDKFLLLHEHKSPFFYISSYQFTSPVPYLAACYLPRIVIDQIGKAKARRTGM